MEKQKTEEIDFVVTWVDGRDPAWRAQRAAYAKTNKGAQDEPAQTNKSAQGEPAKTCTDVDDREERYRDWGLFRYWFRCVETFAPWVRKIHLVTWGHVPEWLNTSHPGLSIVRHEDYIPREFLPTFNSNVLELYLHRIPGLSEQFVYFNDDFYLTGAARPEDFFRNGRPCDMLALQPVVANPKNPVMSRLYLNNSLVLCRYFNKRENMKKQPWAYFRPGYPLMYLIYNMIELAFPKFTGFYTVHGPMPFLKSTFSQVWEREGELLRHVSRNRFRSETDVTPYLFREWQKLSGNFCPRNLQHHFCYYEVGRDTRSLSEILSRHRYRQICVNDGDVGENASKVREELENSFRKFLPEPSSYEKS